LDASLKAIEGARAGIEKDSPLFCDAELARERGELLQATGAHPEESELCFRKALEIARRQNAKSLELRAAFSLSRLDGQQGGKTEGRELLANVYRWFKEGFDTSDLKNARAILERPS
jgi:predicted ATPase